MAHVFSDGFSLYNSMSGATLVKGWAGSDGGTSDMSFTGNGRWGTGSTSIYINDSGTSNAYLTKTLSMSGSTTILGIAITPLSSYTVDGQFLSLTNGTATVALTRAADQKIAITDGASTTYFTTPLSLSSSAWYYLELKINWHSTTGRIIYRMDSSEYYDSGATLALGSTSNATSLSLGKTGVAGYSPRTYYTDLLIMDASTSEFNDFQGDVRIETLLPNGDGSSTSWNLPNNTLLTSANQSRFTTDTSGWTTLSGSPTITRTTTGGPRNAVPAFAGWYGAVGTSIITTPNGTSGYPVSPGQTLAFRCWTRTASYYVNTTIYARFYDAGGVVVGSDLSLGNFYTGWEWTWTGNNVTVPATAATCSIVFVNNNGNSGEFTGIVLSTNSTSPAYTDPAGAHYFATSESVNDALNTYVQSNTVGAKELYTPTNLSPNSTDILGVHTSFVARKENASTHTVATVMKIGGTDYTGGSYSLPDDLSYRHVSNFYPLSPATGVAWTKSEIDNMESGIDIPS